MDLRSLIGCISPTPPKAVAAAAERLRYRDFLIVTLVLGRSDPFPDNWIYVHAPHVRVGRIQNFRAWSRDMVPNDTQASLGMEYFCQRGDDLWDMDDAHLVRMAAEEVETLGLASASDVVDGTVIRQPMAYPVYDTQYRKSVEEIAEWMRGFENLETVGRNGLHRYNNQDHSMLSAIYAVENIFGAEHDLWSVNVDRSYQETFQREDNDAKKFAAE